MVSRWANRFRAGCVSIDNDPRPERPRTSTDERSVKLVTDVLEEDPFEPREQNLRRKILKNRPQLLLSGPLILHDNVHPRIADVLTKKFREYGWEVLPHAPYSPDMSPTDFNLFPKLKELMRGHFSSLKVFPTDATRAI